MREEFINGVRRNAVDGITPAHAGRMSARVPALSTGQDHPRACGKNPTVSSTPGSAVGSPPRMREESYSYRRRSCSPGITPAHAGRIGHGEMEGTRGEDHPRACGKNRKK